MMQDEKEPVTAADSNHMKPLICKHRRFRNEQGNDILIEVGDLMYGEVMIRVFGPNSISENFLTPMEATMLRDTLVEWSA
jgi:hypothetical protein